MRTTVSPNELRNSCVSIIQLRFNYTAAFQFILTNIGGNCCRSQATFTVSKYAKAGYWHVDQIKVTDVVGNQRFAGTNDFGWRFHLNNVLEDTDKPVYVQDSLAMTKTAATLKGNAVQWVSVSWLFTDASPMEHCDTHLIDDSTETTHSTYVVL